MKLLTKITAIVATTLCASFAQAAVFTYDNWVYNNKHQVDWLVTVDDESNVGQFTFNVSIGDKSTVGDILGFGFDTDIDYGKSALDNITNYSSYDFSKCKGPCNWKGTKAKNLDYTFKVGQNGSGKDFVTSFSFGIDSLGYSLDANTFSMVGIRAQSVGPKQKASVKNYSKTTKVHSVPELSASLAPISLALLAGLMLMGFERRRKQA